MVMEGRWGGGSIPPGFIVDMRKTLPDGSKNENWKRYVIFEPYAEVVRRYFTLFLETGGCAGTTLRRIHKEGICYPDPTICLPPEGFKVSYGIRRRGNGYFPGTSAIRHILTNAAYIGHWCVNDAVVRWNNHPAIISNDIFFQAFNYLSQNTLDGSKNVHYRPYRQFARPLKDEERPVERPLLSGMIVSEVDGEWYTVGSEYVKREKHYRYLLYTHKVLDDYVWSKNTDWVDDAVVKLLKRKLTATFNSDIWQESIETFETTYTKERKFKVAQITALEKAMQNLLGSIETLSNPDVIKAVEKRYEDAKAEHKRLTNELATADEQSSQLATLYQLKDKYDMVISNWEQMTRDEKRVVLHAFIDQIEGVPYESLGLYIIICWRDGSRDRISLPRIPSHGEHWTFDEHERLTALLDANATQEEIAAAFPQRKWKVIRDRIFRTRDWKAALFTPKPIRDFESYEEFQQRIADNPNYQLKARHIWRKDELSTLAEMLDGGATKMEIAQTFPYRLWTHIRTKISQLRGSDFEVPGDKPIRSKESYMMYQIRISQEQGLEPSTSDSSNTEPDDPSAPIRCYMRNWCWKGRRRA